MHVFTPNLTLTNLYQKLTRIHSQTL